MASLFPEVWYVHDRIKAQALLTTAIAATTSCESFAIIGARGLASRDLKGLFLAHRRELFIFLKTRLGNHEDAADLTQEVFLRYAEQGGEVIIQPRSYLYRTAHNLAIDHRRRTTRRRTDPTPQADLDSIVEDGPLAEDMVDARQRLALLQAAIAELPDRTQRIFMLHRIEELTYAQIAARLAISESSVQKHLASALRHVMQRLRP